MPCPVPRPDAGSSAGSPGIRYGHRLGRQPPLLVAWASPGTCCRRAAPSAFPRAPRSASSACSRRESSTASTLPSAPPWACRQVGTGVHEGLCCDELGAGEPPGASHLAVVRIHDLQGSVELNSRIVERGDMELPLSPYSVRLADAVRGSRRRTSSSSGASWTQCKCSRCGCRPWSDGLCSGHASSSSSVSSTSACERSASSRPRLEREGASYPGVHLTVDQLPTDDRRRRCAGRFCGVWRSRVDGASSSESPRRPRRCMSTTRRRRCIIVAAGLR